MVLAEKCPNCGAFLPPRVRGAATRKCEFCGLELRGDSRTIDVPALTPENAKQALLEALRARPPSTWLPPGASPPAGDPAAVVNAYVASASSIGKYVLVFLLCLFSLIGGIIYLAWHAQYKRLAPLRAQQADRDAYKKAVATAATAAGGFNDLDGTAFLPFVTATADKLLPGAQLTNLRLPYVKSSGHCDFSLGDENGYAEFRSAAASRPPPGTPIGVDKQVACALQVNIGPTYNYPPSLDTSSVAQCRDPLLLPPLCTGTDIWKRALADGAPANAVASLRYDTERDEAADPDVPRRGHWRLDINVTDGHDWWHEYPDDCGLPPVPKDAPGADGAAATPAVPPASDDEVKAISHQRLRLHSCLKQAIAGHQEIEAVNLRMTFTLDDHGAPQSITVDAEMDIEGLFMGDLSAITRTFDNCAKRPLAAINFPSKPGARQIFAHLRLTSADGKLTPIP